MSFKLPYTYVFVKRTGTKFAATAALNNGRGCAINALQAPCNDDDNVLRCFGIIGVLCIPQGRQDMLFFTNVLRIRDLIKVISSGIVCRGRQLNVSISKNRATRARNDAYARIA